MKFVLVKGSSSVVRRSVLPKKIYQVGRSVSSHLLFRNTLGTVISLIFTQGYEKQRRENEFMRMSLFYAYVALILVVIGPET